MFARRVPQPSRDEERRAPQGCLRRTASHLENGRSVPKITTAVVLCEFYGLPLKKLIAAVVEDEL